MILIGKIQEHHISRAQECSSLRSSNGGLCPATLKMRLLFSRSVFGQTTSSKTLSLFASTRPGCSCLILLSGFAESRISEPSTFLYSNSLEYSENSGSTFIGALVFSSAIFPLFFLRRTIPVMFH